MKENLKLLVDLQEVDSLILRKETEIEKLPEEIRRFRGPLLESERICAKERARYDAVEKKKKEKELEIREIGDRIDKLRSRMSDIKTNKEYQAFLKEIEAIEKEKSRKEDEVLYMMEELDEVSAGLREAEKVMEEEKKRLEAVQRDLDAKKALLEEELAGLKERRAGIAAMIPPELYTRYMDVFRKSKGLAVVEARDEVCLGCYMSIPPQLYVEIRTSNEIIQCPQCGRFLYRKEDAAVEKEGVSAQKAD